MLLSTLCLQAKAMLQICVGFVMADVPQNQPPATLRVFLGCFAQQQTSLARWILLSQFKMKARWKQLNDIYSCEAILYHNGSPSPG